MGLETGTFLDALVTTNPDGATDAKSQGDDHLRLVKKVLKNTFPSATQEMCFPLLATGVADAYVLTPSPAITAYVKFQQFVVQFPVSNATTTPDINISILGNKTLVKADGTALVIGDLLVNSIHLIIYDGANFRILSVIPIDTSSVVPTGEVTAYIGATAPTGWVFGDGKTISDAGNGGTSRSNADTEALFTLLWDSWANTEAALQDNTGTPVARGASASADFNANNRRITLPDLMGRTIAGKETAATRLTVAGSGVDGGVLGKAGGGETHQLTEAELASHSHLQAVNTRLAVNGGFTLSAGVTDGGTGGTTLATGGDAAHQNTQPTLVMNWKIKL